MLIFSVLKEKTDKFTHALVLSILMLIIVIIFAENNYILKKENDLNRNTSITEINTTKKKYEDMLAKMKQQERYIIYSYIKENHKRVPKEVVESITTNILILSKEQNVPVELLVGIIGVESDFNPTVVSNKKARGLMQVRYSVWGEQCKFLSSAYDLHDINLGIRAGIYVLKYYLGKTNNDISEALYLYVGKDRAYSNKVHAEIGKFILHKANYM